MAASLVRNWLVSHGHDNINLMQLYASGFIKVPPLTSGMLVGMDFTTSNNPRLLDAFIDTWMAQRNRFQHQAAQHSPRISDNSLFPVPIPVRNLIRRLSDSFSQSSLAPGSPLLRLSALSGISGGLAAEAEAEDLPAPIAAENVSSTGDLSAPLLLSQEEANTGSDSSPGRDGQAERDENQLEEEAPCDSQEAIGITEEMFVSGEWD